MQYSKRFVTFDPLGMLHNVASRGEDTHTPKKEHYYRDDSRADRPTDLDAVHARRRGAEAANPADELARKDVVEAYRAVEASCRDSVRQGHLAKEPRGDAGVILQRTMDGGRWKWCHRHEDGNKSALLVSIDEFPSRSSFVIVRTRNFRFSVELLLQI